MLVVAELMTVAAELLKTAQGRNRRHIPQLEQMASKTRMQDFDALAKAERVLRVRIQSGAIVRCLLRDIQRKSGTQRNIGGMQPVTPACRATQR